MICFRPGSLPEKASSLSHFYSDSGIFDYISFKTTNTDNLQIRPSDLLAHVPALYEGGHTASYQTSDRGNNIEPDANAAGFVHAVS